jgi:transaldolase
MPSSAFTSNPTIFAKALSAGDAYDKQIADGDGDAKSVFLALAIRDVADASDLLRPVWEETQGRDGYVSIEVDPNLANDTEGTIAQATYFHEKIARSDSTSPQSVAPAAVRTRAGKAWEVPGSASWTAG